MDSRESLPRLGLACALTPSFEKKDVWNMVLTKVRLNANSTEPEIGEATIHELHNSDASQLAIDDFFKQIDDLIKEKHKGKVQVTVGTDYRKEVRSKELTSSLQNNFVTKLFELAQGTPVSLASTLPFEKLNSAFQSCLRAIFNGRTAFGRKPLNTDDCDFETRQFNVTDHIEQMLGQASSVASNSTQAIADYIYVTSQYFSHINNSRRAANATSTNLQYQEPRFYPLPKIKSPHLKIYEEAREAIFGDKDLKERLFKNLSEEARLESVFCLKFLGLDDKAPPYADVIAATLLEKERDENPDLATGLHAEKYFVPKRKSA